jgi:hypothetical protein
MEARWSTTQWLMWIEPRLRINPSESLGRDPVSP